MLSGQNIPLAQLDTGPDDDYAPFSGLPVGEKLIERAGLLVPGNAPEGDYQLIAGLYNPNDEGARLHHASTAGLRRAGRGARGQAE